MPSGSTLEAGWRHLHWSLFNEAEKESTPGDAMSFPRGSSSSPGEILGSRLENLKTCPCVDGVNKLPVAEEVSTVSNCGESEKKKKPGEAISHSSFSLVFQAASRVGGCTKKPKQCPQWRTRSSEETRVSQAWRERQKEKKPRLHTMCFFLCAVLLMRQQLK